MRVFNKQTKKFLYLEFLSFFLLCSGAGAGEGGAARPGKNGKQRKRGLRIFFNLRKFGNTNITKQRGYILFPQSSEHFETFLLCGNIEVKILHTGDKESLD